MMSTEIAYYCAESLMGYDGNIPQEINHRNRPFVAQDT